MKIFWSWQSDTPGKTGRHFIRQALLDAINELKQPEDVEEPIERENRDALHLDQDRQGVPGSPDLARTILDKIDASTVFVADVTPISTIPARKTGNKDMPEKRNMNPNVAIELGYALHALTDLNILMVLNTHYGDRTFLPFDLAHKGGPIQFDLPPDAHKKKRGSEAAILKGQFVTALRPYIRRQSGAAAAVAFRRTPSSISPAVYFQPGETLATIGDEDDRTEYNYPDGRGFYLRIIPSIPLPQPITRSELVEKVRRSGLHAMWRTPSGLFSDNPYGVVVVEPVSPNGGNLQASTQLFGNGEIWGLAPWLLKNDAYGKRVPGKACEDTSRLTLRRYVDFVLNKLNIPLPYTVEAGAVGLKGLRIAVDSNLDNSYGPIYDEAFQVERILNDASQPSLDQVLLAIFDGLFRLSGYPRPQGLFGFPTSPPA